MSDPTINPDGCELEALITEEIQSPTFAMSFLVAGIRAALKMEIQDTERSGDEYDIGRRSALNGALAIVEENYERVLNEYFKDNNGT